MHQCTENMEVLYSMIPITWGLIVAFFYLSSFYLSVISKFSKINLVILHTKKIVKVFFGVLLKFLFI